MARTISAIFLNTSPSENFIRLFNFDDLEFSQQHNMKMTQRFLEDIATWFGRTRSVIHQRFWWITLRTLMTSIISWKVDIAHSLQTYFARATPLLPLTLSFSLSFAISFISSERMLFRWGWSLGGERCKRCAISNSSQSIILAVSILIIFARNRYK